MSSLPSQSEVDEPSNFPVPALRRTQRRQPSSQHAGQSRVFVSPEDGLPRILRFDGAHEHASENRMLTATIFASGWNGALQRMPKFSCERVELLDRLVIANRWRPCQRRLAPWALENGRMNTANPSKGKR